MGKATARRTRRHEAPTLAPEHAREVARATALVEAEAMPQDHPVRYYRGLEHSNPETGDIDDASVEWTELAGPTTIADAEALLDELRAKNSPEWMATIRIVPADEDPRTALDGVDIWAVLLPDDIARGYGTVGPEETGFGTGNTQRVAAARLDRVERARLAMPVLEPKPKGRRRLLVRMFRVPAALFSAEPPAGSGEPEAPLRHREAWAEVPLHDASGGDAWELIRKAYDWTSTPDRMDPGTRAHSLVVAGITEGPPRMITASELQVMPSIELPAAGPEELMRAQVSVRQLHATRHGARHHAGRKGRTVSWQATMPSALCLPQAATALLLTQSSRALAPTVQPTAATALAHETARTKRKRAKQRKAKR